MGARSDNFNRADGSLGTPSDGGSNWVLSDSSTWVVNSNAVRCTANAAIRIAYLETTDISSMAVSAKIATVGTNFGVVARCLGHTDFVAFSWVPGFGYRLFQRITGSTWVQLSADVAGTPSAGQVFKLVCSGGALGTVSAFVDGVQIFAPVSMSVMSVQTKGGVFTSEDTTAKFDDFSIVYLDDLAPTLSAPTGTQTGTATATVGATTNEGDGTLYAFVSTSATPPIAATLKAGTGAVWAGSQVVTSIGAKTLSATGLTNSTGYYAHLIHTDAAGNDSARVTSASFTTLSAATALLAAGAVIGPVSAPSGTIVITANGWLAASKTVAASDGAGGSFAFAGGATLTNGGSVTCTYTPISAGAKTLTFSVSDASLTPVAHPFTASAYSMTVGPFGLNTGSGPLLSTALSYTAWAGVDTGAISGTALNGIVTTHATTGVAVITGLPAAGSYLVSLKNADGSGRWHNLGTAA